MRNPNSGAPFMDSDDEIAAALQDVSIPTLLLSCVHMTDDESVRRAILDSERQRHHEQRVRKACAPG